MTPGKEQTRTHTCRYASVTRERDLQILPSRGAVGFCIRFSGRSILRTDFMFHPSHGPTSADLSLLAHPDSAATGSGSSAVGTVGRDEMGNPRA